MGILKITQINPNFWPLENAPFFLIHAGLEFDNKLGLEFKIFWGACEIGTVPSAAKEAKKKPKNCRKDFVRPILFLVSLQGKIMMNH